MNFAVFQIITALVGVALVVVAVMAWLSGLYGWFPALVAFGGLGWLLASFLPTGIAGIVDARRHQSPQNAR